MLRVVGVFATLAAAFVATDALILEALAVELEAARICTIAVLRLVFNLIADIVGDRRQAIFLRFMLSLHLANSLRLVRPAGVFALAAEFALLSVELRVLLVGRRMLLLVVGALALD